MIPKWKEQSLNPSIFRQASQFLKSCLNMGDWSQDTEKCSNSLCGCDIMGYGSVCLCCSSWPHHKSSARDWSRVTMWWRRLLILSPLRVYHLTKKVQFIQIKLFIKKMMFGFNILVVSVPYGMSLLNWTSSSLDGKLVVLIWRVHRYMAINTNQKWQNRIHKYVLWSWSLTGQHPWKVMRDL